MRGLAGALRAFATLLLALASLATAGNLDGAHPSPTLQNPAAALLADATFGSSPFGAYDATVVRA